eukprot:jgi/Mesvir1/25938/Mv20932-RA.1
MGKWFGGGSSSSGTPADVAPHVPKAIEWENYNYPPLINVVHFQLSDLEEGPRRRAVRCAHYTFLYLCFCLVFNAVVNIVVVVGDADDKKGLHIMYSVFNLMIFSIVGMYAFYNGYKGLCTQNIRMTYKYMALQILITAFIVVSAFARGANFNGWGNAPRANESRRMSTVWVVLTLVEASFWTTCLVISLLSLFLIFRNRVHGRPMGTLITNPLATGHLSVSLSSAAAMANTTMAPSRRT